MCVWTAAAKVCGWTNINETTPNFDIGGMIIVDFDLLRVKGALRMQKR